MIRIRWRKPSLKSVDPYIGTACRFRRTIPKSRRRTMARASRLRSKLTVDLEAQAMAEASLDPDVPTACRIRKRARRKSRKKGKGKQNPPRGF